MLLLSTCGFAYFGSGCTEQPPGSRIDPTRPAAELVKDDDLYTGLPNYQPPETPERVSAGKQEIATKVAEAEQAMAAGQWNAAVTALERALYLEPAHRNAKLLMVKALHARSQATEGTDLYGSGADIRTAATYLRFLLSENDDFTEKDRREFALVYFDEARQYGKTNHREDEFTAAFNSAMEMGFDDLERLKSEPDLDPFRMHPMTARVIERAIATLEAKSGNADEAAAEDRSRE